MTKKDIIILLCVIVICCTVGWFTGYSISNSRYRDPIDSSEPQVVDTPTPENYMGLEPVGCAEDVCVYTFISYGRQCFLAIGVRRFHSTWMFDLECEQ